jgi:cell wall-associated NlpC family hydrolase
MLFGMEKALVCLLGLMLAACSTTPVARVDTDRVAAERAASHALKMLGKPYRYGGMTPSSGFDCSGLVHFSYRQAGVSVPRSTEMQLRASAPVRGAQLRRGDLLFFDQDGKKKGHVAIYVGDGQFVHAPSSGKRVRADRLDSPYWKKHLAEVRRI